MASYTKDFEENLGIHTAGDFPYTFPIIWEATLSFRLTKNVFDTLSVGDYIASIVSFLIVDAMYLQSFYRYLWNIARSPHEGLDLSHYISKSITHYRKQSVAIGDYLSYASDTFSIYLEQMTLNSYLYHIWTSFLILTQSTALQDMLEKIRLKLTMLQLVDLIDYRYRAWNAYLSIYSGINLADMYDTVSNWLYTILQSIDITDYLSCNISFYLVRLQEMDITSIFRETWSSFRLRNEYITFPSYLHPSVWNIDRLVGESIDITELIKTSQEHIYHILQSISLSHFTLYISEWYEAMTQPVLLDSYYNSAWLAYIDFVNDIDTGDYLEPLIGRAITFLQGLDITQVLFSTIWQIERYVSQPMTLTHYLKTVYFEYHTLILDTEVRLLTDYITSTVWDVHYGMYQSISLSDYWDRVWNTFFEIVDGMNLWQPFFGTISSFVLSLNVGVTVVDMLESVGTTLVDLIDTLQFVDVSFIRWSGRVYIVVSTLLSDSLSHISEWHTSLIRGLSIVPAIIVSRSIRQYVSDIMAVQSDITRAIRRVSTEAISILDRVFTGSVIDLLTPISISDSVTHFYRKYITDVLLIQSLYYRVTDIYSAHKEYLVVTEHLSYLMALVYGWSETITTADYIDSVSSWTRDYIESTGIIDTLNNIVSFYRSIEDRIYFEALTVMFVGQVEIFVEQIQLTGTLSHISQFYKDMLQDIAIISSVLTSSTAFRLMKEWIAMGREVAFQVAVSRELEELVILDYNELYRYIVQILSQPMDLIDTLSTVFGQLITILRTEDLDLSGVYDYALDHIRHLTEDMDITATILRRLYRMRLRQEIEVYDPGVLFHITYSFIQEVIIDGVFYNLYRKYVTDYEYFSDSIRMGARVHLSDSAIIQDLHSTVWNIRRHLINGTLLEDYFRRPVVDAYHMILLYTKKIKTTLIGNLQRHR